MSELRVQVAVFGFGDRSFVMDSGYIGSVWFYTLHVTRDNARSTWEQQLRRNANPTHCLCSRQDCEKLHVRFGTLVVVDVAELLADVGAAALNADGHLHQMSFELVTSQPSVDTQPEQLFQFGASSPRLLQFQRGHVMLCMRASRNGQPIFRELRRRPEFATPLFDRSAAFGGAHPTPRARASNDASAAGNPNEAAAAQRDQLRQFSSLLSQEVAGYAAIYSACESSHELLHGGEEPPTPPGVMFNVTNIVESPLSHLASCSLPFRGVMNNGVFNVKYNGVVVGTCFAVAARCIATCTHVIYEVSKRTGKMISVCDKTFEIINPSDGVKKGEFVIAKCLESAGNRRPPECVIYPMVLDQIGYDIAVVSVTVSDAVDRLADVRSTFQLIADADHVDARLDIELNNPKVNAHQQQQLFVLAVPNGATHVDSWEETKLHGFFKYELLHTCETVDTFSGAPVINRRGQLVGIHRRRDATVASVRCNIAIRLDLFLYCELGVTCPDEDANSPKLLLYNRIRQRLYPAAH